MTNQVMTILSLIIEFTYMGGKIPNYKHIIKSQKFSFFQKWKNSQKKAKIGQKTRKNVKKFGWEPVFIKQCRF